MRKSNVLLNYLFEMNLGEIIFYASPLFLALSKNFALIIRANPRASPKKAIKPSIVAATIEAVGND